jgi:hypothetical protein
MVSKCSRFFFCILVLFLKKMFMFNPLDDLILFLNFLFGVIGCPEVTQLGATNLDTKVCAPLVRERLTRR